MVVCPVGNITEDLSFVARNRTSFKDAQTRFCASLRFTHVLTLAWNRDTPLEAAKRDLRRLHRRVDEHLLGRHFFKLSSEARSFALFAFEGERASVHTHALWRVPPTPLGTNRLLRFHKLFPQERGGVWNEIVPSGSYKLRIISDFGDAARYVLKEQHLGSDDDTLLWSTDFGRA